MLLDLVLSDPRTPPQTLVSVLGERLSHAHTVKVLTHPNLPPDLPRAPTEIGGPDANIHLLLADPAMTAANRAALLDAGARGGALFYTGSFHPGVALSADELADAHQVANAVTGQPDAARRKMNQFLAAHPRTPEPIARQAISELTADPAPTRLCAFAVTAAATHQGWDLRDVVDLAAMDPATSHHALLRAYVEETNARTPLPLAGFFLEQVDLSQGIPAFADELAFCIDLTSDLALAQTGLDMLHDNFAREELSISARGPYAVVTNAIVANAALPLEMRRTVAATCTTTLVRNLAATGTPDLATYLLARATRSSVTRDLLANPNLAPGSTPMLRDIADTAEGHAILAAHPGTTAQERAAHLQASRALAAGDQFGLQASTTLQLCDIVEHAHSDHPGSMLDIPTDVLSATVGFMSRRNVHLDSTILAGMRTHPCWPMDSQTLTAARAVEQAFDGTVRELLDVAHATTL